MSLGCKKFKGLVLRNDACFKLFHFYFSINRDWLTSKCDFQKLEAWSMSIQNDLDGTILMNFVQNEHMPNFNSLMKEPEEWQTWRASEEQGFIQWVRKDKLKQLIIWPSEGQNHLGLGRHAVQCVFSRGLTLLASFRMRTTS